MIKFILIFAFIFGCFIGLIVADHNRVKVPRAVWDEFVLLCVVVGALVMVVLTLIILSFIIQPV